MIDEVGAHIADGAGSPVDPAAPVEGVVDAMVGHFRRGSEEEVPVDAGGNALGAHRLDERLVDAAGGPVAALRAGRGGCRRGRLWTRHALWPEVDGAIGPDVDLGHLAEDAGLDPLVDQRRALAGMAHVAHLSDDAGSGGDVTQDTGFLNRPGEGLLDVGVLAQLHGGLADDGVGVVRGGDDDGVDVLALFEQFAVVGVAFGALVGLLELLSAGELLLLHLLHPRGLLGGGGGSVGAAGASPHRARPRHPVDLAVDIAVIDIAHGDHLLAALNQLAGVGLALSAAADEGEMDGVARGLVAGASQDVAGKDHRADGRSGRPRHKFPPRQLRSLFLHTCSFSQFRWWEAGAEVPPAGLPVFAARRDSTLR